MNRKALEAGIFPLRLAIIVILLVAIQLFSSAVHAQGEFPTDANCEVLVGPIMGKHLHARAVIDREGTIHLFWKGLFGYSGQSSEAKQPLSDVNYRKWDGSTWSPVYNIIHTPDELHYAPLPIVDNRNIIHMLWEDNGIRYSQSPAHEAHLPHKWLHSILLMEPLPAAPAFAVAPSGELYVIAPTYRGTLVLLKSNNGGISWSGPSYVTEPQVVSGDLRKAQYVAVSSAAVDNSGRLHLVWTSYPEEAYPALGLFYMHSDDGGATWSEPFALAPAHHDHARLVALDARNLLVAWDGDVTVRGRYVRRSSDGGLTWGDIETILSPSYPGGLTDPPGVAVDSTGHIHVLMSSDDWAYYNSWNGMNWTGPRRMPVCQAYWTNEQQLKARAEVVAKGASPLEISSPNLFVTEGNHLHAIWQSFTLGIVYVNWRVDAPQISISSTQSISYVVSVRRDDVKQTVGWATPTPEVPDSRSLVKLSGATSHRVGGNVRAMWDSTVVGILLAVITISIVTAITGFRIKRHGSKRRRKRHRIRSDKAMAVSQPYSDYGQDQTGNSVSRHE